MLEENRSPPFSTTEQQPLKNQFHLLTFLFPFSPDAEWIAHSEQLCHSTQHPSLPPSHPSVSLHGVQRHHLGLCDRTHMAAGQWQCSISPQLWHRRPSGLQELEPRRHPPGHRLGAVKASSTDWCGRGAGGGVGGETARTGSLSPVASFHSSFFYEGLGPQDPYLCRSVCDPRPPPPSPPRPPRPTHTPDQKTLEELTVCPFYKLQTCRTGVLKNWCMTPSTSVNTIPSSQILYRTLLQMSLGKKKQKGVMYNFMNKQSQKRERKKNNNNFALVFQGALLTAIVFICLYAFFLCCNVLIKATVLWSIVPPPPPHTHTLLLKCSWCESSREKFIY